MRRSRRRHTRAVKRLARAFAALDEHAALARPEQKRLLRSHLGAAR
jgi:hypothetical protein